MTQAPRIARRLHAAHAWIEDASGARLASRVAFDLDAQGQILAVHTRSEADAEPVATERPQSATPDFVHLDLGPALVLPGMVNAHSHAFQRAIRGATHRRGEHDPSSFWSWRSAMYDTAQRLDPDAVYEISRRCYAEMLAAGITCVGEFHYLHHQPDGQPYAEPNRLGAAVVAAAREVGLRMTLLDVAYQRAGHGRAALPEQRRFCDADIDAYLARVESAIDDFEDERRVRVGVAPHSVRALTEAQLRRVATWANEHDVIVHAHVSEQIAENEACQAEHGCSPTELLARCGLLDRPGRFTAVHAIHLTPLDFERLANQNVCACPSTEADLGDGIVEGDRLARGGSTLCLGSDSNARVDLVHEAASLEMHLRLLRQARLVFGPEVGPFLASTATRGGARALGWEPLGSLRVGAPFDAAVVDLCAPQLAELEARAAFDAFWTGGGGHLVTQTWVDGQRRY